MAQWNPLNDLMTLQDRMNRLFEDASQRRGERAYAGVPRGAQEAGPGDELEGADWYPAADVYERENEYTVAVDVPGLDRTTLDISLDDNRLSIRGTRPALEATQHRQECPSGRFLRTFSVPTTVDQQAIKADYKDGVLQIHLPKLGERATQRVKIKVS